MSKTRIFALTIIVLMLIAVFTNPKQEQHEEAIKEKAAQLLRQESGDKNKEIVDFGMQLFGYTLVDQFVQTHVKVENYYLFSLTKIRWNGEENIIGGGAFKYIWLSPKMDEKASEIVEKIKTL
ncbi:DUF4359 domain-containing protein [Sphingobacterium wenxiniae]|uniref:DUF4359 domain-containing protein n=1 Tax=Sphingobacterium wenxiniae TaxID=683125 RepID=A0A1I6S910_9SPHI|nr:DUF4359 domain-containing protein [Sphingobacterium wenxiniae]SFS73383.1 protein of unknown function [Sphingobacterium wenxiniae]